MNLQDFNDKISEWRDRAIDVSDKKLLARLYNISVKDLPMAERKRRPPEKIQTALLQPTAKRISAKPQRILNKPCLGRKWVVGILLAVGIFLIASMWAVAYAIHPTQGEIILQRTVHENQPIIQPLQTIVVNQTVEKVVEKVVVGSAQKCTEMISQEGGQTIKRYVCLN